MCLLVMVSRLEETAPLVVGANRDERLDRPATAITVLQSTGPRILGGRDEEAGGTWLAVNEHGLVAALTNRPASEDRDPSKRSRGELPLALARHSNAQSAVADFASRFHPVDYNPAWLLVGDRYSLYSLDMTGARPVAQQLPAGIHILENLPLGSRSPKVDHVREMLGTVGSADLKGEALLGRLRRVLGDHSLPDEPDGSARPSAKVTVGDRTGADQSTSGRTSSEQAASGQFASQTGASQSLTTVPGPVRPPGTLAACVHTETYGTRSSTIVRVPASADAQIFVSVADGPPCRTPFVDADGLWRP